LDADQGNRIRSVVRGSAAARVGLRAGDLLRTVNGVATASIADAQYGLHKAPARGTLAISWTRAGRTLNGSLVLKQGWRKTDITWRPSLQELVPTLPLDGSDLTAAEKKAIGLPVARVAFRQKAKVASWAAAAGVSGGDIIIGIDERTPEMTTQQFQEYVRTNYLVGDRVTLHIIRRGKRLQVPLTLH
jgi:S1-C subfamily serine protease